MARYRARRATSHHHSLCAFNQKEKERRRGEQSTRTQVASFTQCAMRCASAALASWAAQRKRETRVRVTQEGALPSQGRAMVSTLSFLQSKMCSLTVHLRGSAARPCPGCAVPCFPRHHHKAAGQTRGTGTESRDGRRNKAKRVCGGGGGEREGGKERRIKRKEGEAAKEETAEHCIANTQVEVHNSPRRKVKPKTHPRKKKKTEEKGKRGESIVIQHSRKKKPRKAGGCKRLEQLHQVLRRQPLPWVFS